jgi:hypothetical protein
MKIEKKEIVNNKVTFLNIKIKESKYFAITKKIATIQIVN